MNAEPDARPSDSTEAEAAARMTTDSGRAGAESIPDRIGDYRVIAQLGEGRGTIVYRAREAGSEREVALKSVKPREAARADVLQSFRDSAEIAARLEHSHIVRAYDTTKLHAEPPFYTMQLVSGGTLARSRSGQLAWDPRDAAELMSKVADAVHFAHEQGILHRALKPSSILLDFEGEPYVTDFTTARAEPLVDVAPENVPYLAPERARREPARKCTDVYGLGAVFYELLAGRPPVAASTVDELCRLDRARQLKIWQSSLSHVDAALREICLAALADNPSDRPPTAHLFADGLRRALNFRPPLFPPAPRIRRMRLWTLRHPLLALSAAFGMVLLVAADVAMFVMARVEQGEIGKDILHTNAALASAQARGVLAGLKRYSDYTLQAASHPALRELLVHLPAMDPGPALRDIYERSGVLDPSVVFLVDASGVLVSIWPSPMLNLGKSYGFRDYFECTRALARTSSRSVCISPAYRSETDDAIHFAFSSPVYDAVGTWVGTLVLTRHAARTLGEIDFNDRYRSAQVTSVIGGRGADRQRPANREEMIVVVHPDLHGNSEFQLDQWLAKRLTKEFNLRTGGGYVDRNDSLPFEYDSYVDPVSAVPERMLASFAPVGQTGYVVAVATPYQNAQRPSQRLLDLLFTYGSVLNLCFVAIALVAVWASLREPRTVRDPAG